MKPECETCKQTSKQGSMSSTFGKQFVEDMMYNLFNPDATGDDKERLDLEDLIDSFMDSVSKEMIEQQIQNMTRTAGENWIYREWLEGYAKREAAREKAWQNILDRIKSGEVKLTDISMKQLLRTFPRMILEGLNEEGLVDLRYQKQQLHPKAYLGYAEFTVESERLIAARVLEEAFRNLEKMGFGLHELKEAGFGTYPSNLLVQYDDYMHTYDMLDIQETMVSTAIRNPEHMEISDADLKSRTPIHRAKSANVILMDISYSMHGAKFRGGMMAALALRQLLEGEFKEDILRVIAYNDDTFLVPEGRLLRLRPHGNTDIGRAIDLATQVLSKEEGNKNVFLITDSEPTASYLYDQSPEENAYRAAYQAGIENVRLHLIMLDQKPELRRICERLAELGGNSTVTFVENPLNLKEFLIKTFVDYKRRWNRT